ncbi:MAG TPA: hypothetical protein DDZ43_04400 [Hyphomonadaceae bacterium]|nr:hypothetical protein [Ponticaulis sp.]HBH89841.1 hypothetical protein [Hyphomonadaceae bacterium]HBJ92097.1 hypothetical protein [Hyphomonadaceae bacterium]
MTASPRMHDFDRLKVNRSRSFYQYEGGWDKMERMGALAEMADSTGAALNPAFAASQGWTS